MKKMNKKGSHVGVVVSFVIFVTFLVFLYSIIQPATIREKSKSYILDYITLNLIGNSSSEISTLIIYVDESTGNQDCINIQQLSLEQIPEDLREHLIFKNSSGNILSYYLQNINTIKVETGENFQGVISVQAIEGISAQLDDTIGGCDPHTYPLGNLKVNVQMIEEKIYELNETYYADYEGLKADFGVPEGAEFSFYILNSDREIIISAEMYEPKEDQSVYLEETPIEYVNSAGNIEFGFLVVKIW